ncbi:MAG TPA: acetate kinase, partial [Porticoccaceae bacterium]|nr:acetate kinase [Porticoccaceae bacterium]
SKLSVEKIDHLLNHESGLKGLCGSADMREVRSRATNGDADAQQALALYRYRMTKYIGAYFLALGGVDALIFTGGIGEHDTRLRAEVVESLSPLGIR